ncbi:hypothetical protein KQY30_01975 [Streptomyces sp. GMY02]|uniref:hypothetical protein n=1 Tax=Streptomyces sp. GMY02 TaxID=1333528 RepID=UPI001C2C5928|nr:hypothetical protein [Streptomyces sp. GMY02]QXE33243.1 hypothetical protein KQY30_01975 [Streptomyces sp. GMY02]
MTTTNESLWQKWRDLWYDQLDLADEIIAPGFKVCLESDNDLSAINDAQAVRRWVVAVNAIFQEAKFTALVGPIITDEYITTHWGVIGKLGPGVPEIGPEGATFTRVLTEILKVENGLLTECWASFDPVKVSTG